MTLRRLHRNFYWTTSQIKKFANNAFNLESYSLNFPQIFDTPIRSHIYFYNYKNENASLCAVHPIFFFNENIKIICLSSVCVSKNLREKKIAHEMLEDVLESLERTVSKTSYALFSSDERLYHKLGFRTVKEFPLLSLTENILKAIDSESLTLSFKSFDSTIINQSFQKELWHFITVHSKKSESYMSFLEFSTILKIPKMKVISGFSKEGHLKCLCFFGKGDDFKDIFHGFYYIDKSYFKALLIYILSLKKAPLLFLSPLDRRFFSNKKLMDYSSLMIKDISDSSLSKKFTSGQLFIKSLQGI